LGLWMMACKGDARCANVDKCTGLRMGTYLLCIDYDEDMADDRNHAKRGDLESPKTCRIPGEQL